MSQQQLFTILFDSQTSQVEQQALTGTRLNTLFGALTSVFGVAGPSADGGAWPGGAESPLAFTPVGSSSAGPTYGPITSQQLSGSNVLAILTRWQYPQGSGAEFSQAELDAIEQWVAGGGALLLMSNHTFWAKNDQALAAQLGFTLHYGSMISSPGGMMLMEGGDFHPSGVDGAPQIFSGVSSVTAHDGCGISFPDPSPSGTTYAPLVSFPANANAPSGQYFAAIAKYHNGKVVVVANSGWVGDVGNNNPWAGIAPYGSNLLFALNAFAWLAGIPAWNPATGQPSNGG
ncbi:MAG: hypothetical protein ACJ8GN_29715 [Longimicrobiaceae bacterium]